MPYFGWSTDSAFATFAAQCGTPKMHRSYDLTTLPTTWAATQAGPDTANGVILSHWSWKPVVTLFGNSACYVGALTNKQQTTTTAVLTTTSAHGLVAGNTVAVVNCGSASINGVWVVTSSTTTTFTVTVTTSTTVTSQACAGIAVGGGYAPNAVLAGMLATIPAQSGSRAYVITGWPEPGAQFKSGAFTPAQWRDTQVRCGLITQGVAGAFARTDLHYAIVTEGGFTFSTGVPYGDPDTTYWDARMDTAIDYVFHDNYVDLKNKNAWNDTIDATVSLCLAFNARHGNKPYGCAEVGVNEPGSATNPVIYGTSQPGVSELYPGGAGGGMIRAYNYGQLAGLAAKTQLCLSDSSWIVANRAALAAATHVSDAVIQTAISHFTPGASGAGANLRDDAFHMFAPWHEPDNNGGLSIAQFNAAMVNWVNLAWPTIKAAYTHTPTLGLIFTGSFFGSGTYGSAGSFFNSVAPTNALRDSAIAGITLDWIGSDPYATLSLVTLSGTYAARIGIPWALTEVGATVGDSVSSDSAQQSHLASQIALNNALPNPAIAFLYFDNDPTMLDTTVVTATAGTKVLKVATLPGASTTAPPLGAMAAGSVIIVDPHGANPETVTLASQSPAGGAPFSLSLTANLAFTHAAGVPVWLMPATVQYIRAGLPQPPGGLAGHTKVGELTRLNALAQLNNFVGAAYASSSTGSYAVSDSSYLLTSINPADGLQDAVAYWKTLEVGNSFSVTAFDSVPVVAGNAVPSQSLHVNVVTASDAVPVSDLPSSAGKPIVITVPIALVAGLGATPTETLGSPFAFAAPVALGLASALDLVTTVGGSVFSYAPDIVGVSARGLDMAIVLGTQTVLGDNLGLPIVLSGLSGAGSCDLQSSTLEPGEAAALVPAKFAAAGAHSIWLRYTAASSGVLSFTASCAQSGFRVAAMSGSAVDDPLLTLITDTDTDPTVSPASASVVLAVNAAETVYVYLGSEVDTAPFGPVTYQWSFAATVVAPQLQLFPAVLDSVPTSVVVSLLNMGTAGELVDFSIVGYPAVLATLQADPGGVITGASVPIGIPLANGTYRMQAVGRSTGFTATATLTFLRDPATRPAAPPADLPATPPLQVGVQRWVFQDPTPGGLGLLVFPANPAKATNPFAALQLTVEHTVAVDGTAVVWEGAVQPVTLTFSGYTDSPTFYSAVLGFLALNAKFYWIDHYGRVWTVVLTSFAPDRRVVAPVLSSAKPWAMNYTATMEIFAGPM